MAGALDSLLHRPSRNSTTNIITSPLSAFLDYFSTLYFYQPSHSLQSTITSPPLLIIGTPTTTPPIRIVCISDTHNTQPTLPKGDILIHAGDLTCSGTSAELKATLAWIRSLPFAHKIVVAGNHDTCLEDPSQFDWGDITYLHNSSAVLKLNKEHIKVFGSPLTPRHGSFRFQYPRDIDVWGSGKEAEIPLDTDILVTHGPPQFHLDAGGLGCSWLLKRLWEVRPRLAVFGHVHWARGWERVRWDEKQAEYERVCKVRRDKGRLWSRVILQNLLGMVRCVVRRWMGRREKMDGEGTVLVNAAIVHGLRDEKRHEPVVIDYYI